eukprot:5647025-Prymnesium_polylepis.1
MTALGWYPVRRWRSTSRREAALDDHMRPLVTHSRRRREARRGLNRVLCRCAHRLACAGASSRR